MLTTKPGKHGTLHLYVVEYCDAFDRHNRGQHRTWAYSLDHVADKFYDAEDADGWLLLRAGRMPESGLLHRVHFTEFAKEP